MILHGSVQVTSAFGGARGTASLEVNAGALPEDVVESEVCSMYKLCRHQLSGYLHSMDKPVQDAYIVTCESPPSHLYVQGFKTGVWRS